jgi:anaerobic selenocysteine-containing dehydrogenase
MELTTACTMDCPDACALLVSPGRDGALRLRGNPRHPFTAGFTCKKIRRHGQRLRSAERILEPLLRDGRTWRTISWDAALDLCAAKIQELRHQPAAILHIEGSGAKGVTKEAVKLFFQQIGSSRVRGSLCDAAGIMAYHYDFGSRRNPGTGDLFNARCIVNWGKDLSRSSIHMGAMIKKARQKGIRVLTISPGGDGNEPFSDQRIRIRPGTDRFLAAAVIRRLLADKGVPPAIISQTRHWDGFEALIAARRESELIAACGVAGRDVDRLQAFYSDPQGATATIVGAGLQRYRYGGENIRFINALALISGQIGRSGGGSYFHLHALAMLNTDWAHGPARTPRRAMQMATLGRDILSARDPAVQMIWVNGTNVVNQALDSGQIARAFEQVPFKVVVEAFFNDTARRADLILPAALMLEQEDLIGSYFHDTIQYVRVVSEPPGQAKCDHWIISELGRRLSPSVPIPSIDDCLRASLDQEGLKVDLDELRRSGYYRITRPAVPYDGLQFDHPDGKARLPLLLHPEPQAPARFPLRLLTLIRREAIHSQIDADQQKGLPNVWVSPHSTGLASIDVNRPTYLVSPLGRLQVAINTLDGLHPDVVVYRRGDWMALGGGANQLIRQLATDIGGGAAYYDQYVRLEN